MKYFLDTEFHEDGKTIDLLSIGIVAEDGREFYAVNADFDWDRVVAPVTQEAWERTAWLRDNVMPYVRREEGRPRSFIRSDIEAFIWAKPCLGEHKPELWGYYADYDWVAFCQLWGRMIDLPDWLPKFCRDIKQVAVDLGNPQLPTQVSNEHHALADARWNKQAYEFLLQHKHQLEQQAKHERFSPLFEPRFPERLEFGGQSRP
jgi:hypothetical protein